MHQEKEGSGTGFLEHLKGAFLRSKEAFARTESFNANSIRDPRGFFQSCNARVHHLHCEPPNAALDEGSVLGISEGSTTESCYAPRTIASWGTKKGLYSLTMNPKDRDML